jgi:hypothetical protein
VEYVPMADGTHINVYYGAYREADERQLKRVQRALSHGVDPNNLDGSVISIRRCKNGNIQLQFVVRNRDERDSEGRITEDVCIDSISVWPNPQESGGVIAALAFDQSLGIPDHQLKALLQTERARYSTSVLARHLRAGISEAQGGIPSEQPRGTTAAGEGVEEGAK